MSEWGDKLLTEADNARLRAENERLRERVAELEELTDEKRYIPQEWYQLAATENAKLRDENARLCSCLSDDAENARQIMVENAKLRELVRDMTEAFIHGNCYRWCEAEPCNFISDGKCQFLDRMRELGVKL